MFLKTVAIRRWESFLVEVLPFHSYLKPNLWAENVTEKHQILGKARVTTAAPQPGQTGNIWRQRGNRSHAQTGLEQPKLFWGAARPAAGEAVDSPQVPLCGRDEVTWPEGKEQKHHMCAARAICGVSSSLLHGESEVLLLKSLFNRVFQSGRMKGLSHLA